MAPRISTPPWLLAQLVARRIEWLPTIALLFCLIGAVLQFVIHPWLVQRAHAAERAILVARQEPKQESNKDALLAERYLAFRARLAENSERGELLKTIFSEAATAGIPLTQGDYTVTTEIAGDYDKLQINLPLKGSYKTIRAFTMSLLEKPPQASVDEINLRRDTIKNSVVEARVRLTLYLKRAQ